jgi:hypothetical protein
MCRPEFITLMTAHGVDDESVLFPDGWQDGCYHIRLLRHCYNSVDINGDGKMNFSELALAVNSLHSGVLSDEDIELMWTVMNSGLLQRKIDK